MQFMHLADDLFNQILKGRLLFQSLGSLKGLRLIFES